MPRGIAPVGGAPIRAAAAFDADEFAMAFGHVLGFDGTRAAGINSCSWCGATLGIQIRLRQAIVSASCRETDGRDRHQRYC